MASDQTKHLGLGILLKAIATVDVGAEMEVLQSGNMSARLRGSTSEFCHLNSKSLSNLSQSDSLQFS